MKLSVIIPAYNEEKLIGRCLESVADAFRANAGADCTREVIVVDNNSSDRTAELAREAGARVVFEPINQISRARNAGGRVAEGDWFLFIDADSFLHPKTLAELLARIRTGLYAGGGGLIDLDDTPPGARTVIDICNAIMRAMKWAAGSFVFCRRDAFLELGGFSTKLYAAEEIHFSHVLKKWAARRGLRFAFLRGHPHVSSARKFHLYGRGEMLRVGLRWLFTLGGATRDRKKLDIFYDGRR